MARWAGLALTAGMVLLAGASCGRNKPTAPVLSAGGNSVANGLVFSREEDSTIIRMPTNHAVCCSLWEAGLIDRDAIKILYYDFSKTKSNWKVFVLPEEMEGDSTFTLPTPSAGLGPVILYVDDVTTGNEARSDRAGSSGSFTIHSFSCGIPARIDFTVDAFLGSEYTGGERIQVRGRFTATVYTNSIACSFSF